MASSDRYIVPVAVALPVYLLTSLTPALLCCGPNGLPRMVGGNPKGVTCDVAEHHGVHASVLRRHRRQELVAVRRHMNALANGTQRQKPRWGKRRNPGFVNGKRVFQGSNLKTSENSCFQGWVDIKVM